MSDGTTTNTAAALLQRNIAVLMLISLQLTSAHKLIAVDAVSGVTGRVHLNMSGLGGRWDGVVALAETLGLQTVWSREWTSPVSGERMVSVEWAGILADTPVGIHSAVPRSPELAVWLDAHGAALQAATEDTPEVTA